MRRMFIFCLLSLGGYSLIALAQLDLGAEKEATGEDLTLARTAYQEWNDIDATRLYHRLLATQEVEGEASYHLGRIAWGRESLEEAAMWFRRATSVMPEDAESQRWLGLTLHQLALRLDLLHRTSVARQAREALERAVNLGPEDWRNHVTLMLYYLELRDWSNPAPVDWRAHHLAILEALDPARARYAQGQLSQRSGDFELALSEYREAMRLDPGESDYRLSVGYALQGKEDFEAAFDHFDRMLSENPEDLELSYQYARTALFAGENLERGIQEMQKYLAYTPSREAPSPSWAHMRLAELYEKVGEDSLAREHYQHATELRPGFTLAQEALDRLEVVRSSPGGR